MIGDRATNNYDKVSKGRQSKGDDISTAKLTSDNVSVIRKSSKTSFELSAEYGVTFGHINKVRGKRAWTHLE